MAIIANLENLIKMKYNKTKSAIKFGKAERMVIYMLSNN